MKLKKSIIKRLDSPSLFSQINNSYNADLQKCEVYELKAFTTENQLFTQAHSLKKQGSTHILLVPMRGYRTRIRYKAFKVSENLGFISLHKDYKTPYPLRQSKAQLLEALKENKSLRSLNILLLVIDKKDEKVEARYNYNKYIQDVFHGLERAKYKGCNYIQLLNGKEGRMIYSYGCKDLEYDKSGYAITPSLKQRLRKFKEARATKVLDNSAELMLEAYSVLKQAKANYVAELDKLKETDFTKSSWDITEKIREAYNLVSNIKYFISELEKQKNKVVLSEYGRQAYTKEEIISKLSQYKEKLVA